MILSRLEVFEVSTARNQAPITPFPLCLPLPTAAISSGIGARFSAKKMHYASFDVAKI